MLAALQAVKATLASLGYPVYVMSAEAPEDGFTQPVPYLVVELAPGLGVRPDDPAISTCGDREFVMRVRAVSYPADAPLKVAAKVRNILAPNLAPSRIVTSALIIEVAYERTESGGTDRDLLVPGANRHPSWSVDSYTVHTQAVVPVPVP